jgi:hypothetical protein
VRHVRTPRPTPRAGHIITNYHVINDASDIQVTFMGGAEYTAKVVGTDTDKDIAVLQVRLCARACAVCSAEGVWLGRRPRRVCSCALGQPAVTHTGS